MTEQGSTPSDAAPEAPSVDDATPESEGVAPAGDHHVEGTPERPPRTFAEERTVYGAIGRLLAEAAADEQTARQLARADVVLQYRASKPTATITVSARSGQRVTVEYGRTPLAPEVVLGMDGDLLHRYFLGEVNPTTALTKGDIRARGPIAKVLAVLPYVSVLAPRYAALLEANGGELPEPGPEHVAQQVAAPAPPARAPAAAPAAGEAIPPSGDQAAPGPAADAEAVAAPVEPEPAPSEPDPAPVEPGPAPVEPAPDQPTAPEEPRPDEAAAAEVDAVAAEVADLPSTPVVEPPAPVAADDEGDVPAGETASVEVADPEDEPETDPPAAA